MHQCPNCDNNFEGQYCNKCGQQVAHRITMRHIGHDLAHAFTHTDKGFFHLMLALYRNPGKVAREYILEQKRKRYVTPFQYLLIIGAVATFIVVNSHFMINTMRAMGAGGAEISARQAAVMQTMADLQGRYYNFLVMLQLPFLSASTLLVYRKHRLNYAEHLTLHSFISAQTTLTSVILITAIYFFGQGHPVLVRSFISIMIIFSLVYHLVMYTGFFRDRRFKGFAKAFLAYFLGLTIFVILLILSISLIVSLYVK